MIADERTNRLLDNRLKDEFYYQSLSRYFERNRLHFLIAAMAWFMSIAFIAFAGENMRSVYILIALGIAVLMLIYAIWFYVHGKKAHRVALIEMKRTILDYQIRFSQQGMNQLKLDYRNVQDFSDKGFVKSHLLALGFEGLRGTIRPEHVYNLKQPQYYQVGKEYQIKPLFIYNSFGILHFFAYDVQKLEAAKIHKIKKLENEKDSAS